MAPSKVKDLLEQGLDTSEDFTDRALGFLDSSLRCTICSEHFSAPVLLTGCSHSFCSLCLRQALVVSKNCPQCRAEADEGRIKANHALAEIVKAWHSARSALLALQSYATAPSTSTRPTASSSAKRLRSDAASDGEDGSPEPTATAKGGRGYATRSRGKGKEKEMVDESSDIEIVEDVPAATAANKTRWANGKAKSKKIKTEDLADPNLAVSCPICSGSFKNSELNRHLDRCNGMPPIASKSAGESKSAWGDLMKIGSKSSQKNKEKAKDSDSKAYDTTKPLPLISYAGLSLRDLQKKLTELGLPTTVPKDHPKDQLTFLRRRHQQFVTLWNSNADKGPEHAEHRSHAVLIKDLAKWEKTADKPAAAEAQEINDGRFDRAAYQVAHSSDFKALIKQAKEAAARKKAAEEEQKRAEELESELGALEEESQEVSRSQQKAESVTMSDAMVQTSEVEMDDAEKETVTSAPPRPSVRFADQLDEEEPAHPAMRSTPPISSPTPNANLTTISRSPSPSGSLPRSRSVSPVLQPPPDWLAQQQAEQLEAEGAAQRTKREFSPYDPRRPPRPSQRLKEEEGSKYEEEEEVDEEAMGAEE